MANFLSSFFHPERGYKKAGEAMEKYYKDAQGNLQPYNAQGQDQYQKLMEQRNALADPAKLQADWAKSYEMSPYAKQMEAKAKESGLGAASTMGLMGSSAALGNIQQSSHDVMQQDRQQYMNDLMQKYLQSIGISQNIYGTGASAAGGMSNNAMNQGQNMGQVAYGQQMAPGDMFGKIAGNLVGNFIDYRNGGAKNGGANDAAMAAKLAGGG